MDHHELRELTGAYALGALSEAERRALETHLPTCPECAQDVRDAVEAAGALAFAVEPVDPPAALRARVLDAAARDPRTRAAKPSDAPARWTLLPYLATAASLAAIGLAFYAVELRSRIGALEERVRAAESATSGVQARLASLQSEYGAMRRSATILAASDVRRVDLEGQPSAAGASAHAFWSPSRGLVFAATGLPALPPGRVYQLWFVADTAPVSAGLMTPDDTGVATTVAPPPGAGTRVVAFAVTLEPAGGVPAPTTTPLLVGKL